MASEAVTLCKHYFPKWRLKTDISYDRWQKGPTWVGNSGLMKKMKVMMMIMN